MGLAVAGSCLLVAELGFRLWVGAFDDSLGRRIDRHRTFFAPTADLPDILYEPHPYWVYNATAGQPGVNEWGFHFDDDVPLAKPDNEIRIVCLGGSTTAGPQAWPWHLEQQLAEGRSERVRVLNFGTGGWTSEESLVAFTLLGQSFSPDIVVVHHANNDINPLIRTDFRPDYAHFRKPIAIDRTDMGVMRVRLGLTHHADALAVRMSSLYVYSRLWLVGDVPTHYTLDGLSTKDTSDLRPDVNQTAWTFDRNLRSIAAVAKSIGAEMAVSSIPRTDSVEVNWADRLDRQNDRVVRLGREEGWVTIPLHEMDLPRDVFEDPIHVSQEGEALKATSIAAALRPILDRRLASLH